jgi:hypothetical protein
MCRIHLVLNVKIIEWCESSRQFSLLVTTGTPVEPKYTRPGAYNSQQRQVHVVVRSIQQDYESYTYVVLKTCTNNLNKNEKFILYLRLITQSSTILQHYYCPFFFLLPSNINPPRGDFHTSPLLVSPVPCCFRPCR